jgi:uncharacterized protein YcaQ
MALHSQGLDLSPTGATGQDDIYNTVDRIGWVQIDTLQMVHRSQHLVLWSRLGNYDTGDFDALLRGRVTTEQVVGSTSTGFTQPAWSP